MNQSSFTHPDRPLLRGPVRLLLDLFSSIWLGVILLALLFLYSSIGSAGAPVGEGVLRPWFILNPDAWIAVRQLRPFEMTEFEWFHWWPFKLLIALICINLVVATLRRIPFNLMHLGVWMIHSGIIVLALGSVWYFSTKVEGDAPVARRRVAIEAPTSAGIQHASLLAMPGNSTIVGQGDEAYLLRISDIDPHWELLSGDDKGKRAYKVSVLVQSKSGMFIRELLAGYPQYTEDLIRTEDPQQPFARARKALGKPLVDEALKLTLDYNPQQYLYLMDSHALYLREVGQKEWIQRTIEGLPRYNDYIASHDDVWQSPDSPRLPIDPVTGVELGAQEAGDPLPQMTFRVSRYLRYATMESRRRTDPGGQIDPAATVRLHTADQSQSYDLVAFHPEESAALEGNLRFAWVDGPQTLERLRTRIDPVIGFTLAGSSITIDEPITELANANPDLPFKSIGDTGYSYRVENFQDNLTIGNRTTSVAIVQIMAPDGRVFTRWIFDNPGQNRDMAVSEPGAAQHEAEIDLDTNLETIYKPGQRPPAPIMLLAGPGEHDLAVMITKVTGPPQYTAVRVGDSVPVAEGVSLTVERYAPRTVNEVKPFVVPREQQQRDAKDHLSMIALDLPLTDGQVLSQWLPFNNYPFDAPGEVLRRFPYRAQEIVMPDGRRIEFMFSRARLPLPAPVVLDDFEVATHIGGFTGQTSSILDWKSIVKFEADDHVWSKPAAVSVNKPAEFNGYWFFQAMWDPPDQPRFEGDIGSRGMNYTVLGVGNRNGVHVQLAGCMIAVLGMIFTFYAKPIIKRKRQQAAQAQAAVTVGEMRSRAERPQAEPVGAAWRVNS